MIIYAMTYKPEYKTELDVVGEMWGLIVSVPGHHCRFSFLLPSSRRTLQLTSCRNKLIKNDRSAASWQNQQNGMCAQRRLRSDWADPGHPPSLIRGFPVRMKKAWVLSYPLSDKRKLWSDWVDVQADLSLRWVHMPFCWFCHEAAQKISVQSGHPVVYG